jgi:transcriptional regulator with XRE-family HTH domain
MLDGRDLWYQIQGMTDPAGPQEAQEQPRLGPLLREARERQGLGQREIARRARLNSGYISQLEAGKVVRPTPAVLERLAPAYALPFPVLMRWAGHPGDDEPVSTVPEARAYKLMTDLSQLTDEELKAVEGIIDLLRAKRTAPAMRYTGDTPLGPESLATISGYTTALLLEAGAYGKRPTPLDAIRETAGLVLAGELTLTDADRRKLTERFGHWVNRAWSRLCGTIDFRSKEIWIKPDQHAMQRRYVQAHEIGHAILPEHRRVFAYLDDPSRLRPDVRALFEREANQAAAEILFQGDELRREADDSRPSLERVCELGSRFGASILATARRVGETSRQECAVALAYHRDDGGLGRTHLYVSASFDKRFRWKTGGVLPLRDIRLALRSATDEIRVQEDLVLPDARQEPVALVLETLDTGYYALAMFMPQPTPRLALRRRSRSSPAGVLANS